MLGENISKTEAPTQALPSNGVYTSGGKTVSSISIIPNYKQLTIYLLIYCTELDWTF